MTKIAYNNEPIAKNIIPRIDSAISKLDTAIDIDNNIYIPYEYINRDFLNNYFQMLKNVRKTFQDEKNRIEKTNKILNNSMDNFETELSRLKDIDIKFRDQAL